MKWQVCLSCSHTSYNVAAIAPNENLKASTFEPSKTRSFDVRCNIDIKNSDIESKNLDVSDIFDVEVPSLYLWACFDSISHSVQVWTTYYFWASIMPKFEPTKRNLREAMLFCFHLKKSVAGCYSLHVEAYGNHTSTVQTVENWFRRFKSGYFDHSWIQGFGWCLMPWPKSVSSLLRTSKNGSIRGYPQKMKSFFATESINYQKSGETL